MFNIFTKSKFRVRKGLAFGLAAMALISIVGATLVGVTQSLADAPSQNRTLLFIQNILAVTILLILGAYFLRARIGTLKAAKFTALFRLYEVLILALSALIFALGFVLYLLSRGISIEDVIGSYLLRLMSWYALAVIGLATIVTALSLHDGLSSVARRAHRQEIRKRRLTLQNASLTDELERLRKEANAGPNWIAVKSVGKIEFVDPARVSWISSARNYVELHSEGRVILHRTALKEILGELEHEGFVQIRRTAAVNIAYVTQYKRQNGDSASLTLRDGTVVAVGPSFRSSLIEKLEGLKTQV